MTLLLVSNRFEGKLAVGNLSDMQSCATGIFLQTFTRLKRRGIVPSVFYPAVQLPSDEQIVDAQTTWETQLDADLAGFLHGKRVFLSINRFERKKANTHTSSLLLRLQTTDPPTSVIAKLNFAPRKQCFPVQNLGLAVHAFGILQDRYSNKAEASQCALVLAGGYDKRLAENREHFCEMQELIERLGLPDQVHP